jgi:hypothetical protein
MKRTVWNGQYLYISREFGQHVTIKARIIAMIKNLFKWSV